MIPTIQILIADKNPIVRTEGNPVGNSIGKLQVSNQTQTVLYALRRGFASLTPGPALNYSETEPK